MVTGNLVNLVVNGSPAGRLFRVDWFDCWNRCAGFVCITDGSALSFVALPLLLWSFGKKNVFPQKKKRENGSSLSAEEKGRMETVCRKQKRRMEALQTLRSFPLCESKAQFVMNVRLSVPPQLWSGLHHLMELQCWSFDTFSSDVMVMILLRMSSEILISIQEWLWS